MDIFVDSREVASTMMARIKEQDMVAMGTSDCNRSESWRLLELLGDVFLGWQEFLQLWVERSKIFRPYCLSNFFQNVILGKHIL